MEQKMQGAHAMKGGHYGRLLAMVVLSFFAMFGLMYAMVNTFDNVVINLNQFYMAGLMVAPMVIIELALMWNMYPNKKVNGLIMAASAVALFLFWILIRQQAGISDRQFLRSMIPHHAGAILMCEKTRVHDPRIQQLCRDIQSSQQAEIALMKSLLAKSGEK